MSSASRHQHRQQMKSREASASWGISILELLIIFHHWFFPPLLAHSSSLLYYTEASSRACAEFNKDPAIRPNVWFFFFSFSPIKEGVLSVQGCIQILICRIMNNRTALRRVAAGKKNNKRRQKAEGSSAESTPSAATSAVAHVSRAICFCKLIFTRWLGSLIALASMWKPRRRSPSVNVGLLHL